MVPEHDSRTPNSNRWLAGIATILFVLASCHPAAWAYTIPSSGVYQTNGSASDVQAAINAASNGNKILVPAGSFSWSGGISISKGIWLSGAGKTTSGSVITAGKITITKNASAPIRVSGFRFTGNSSHLSIGGASTARAYIIQNCYFYSNGSDFMNVGANGGLFDHNDFYMPPSSAGGPDVMAIQPNENWSQATTFGNADTQGPNGGERNIYFENNTFTNILETAPDGDAGARLVIRYNTYIDSSIVFHSGSPNDTSPDGTRQFEIYNNTFDRVISSNNLNKWVWVRGGSGVIANNTMDSVNTPDYGGKTSIRLGIGCPTGYPVAHQIGQTNLPAQSPPPQPLLIFGNTGVGATESNWLSITANGTGGGGSTGCSNPGNYVKVNRDYYLNNKWNWTPFTYPHPLVTASATSPTAPSGLRVRGGDTNNP